MSQTRISTKKSSSVPPRASFKAPPVIQPKVENKPDAKLPEWKPGGGGAVSPLQRLIDSKAAQAKLTIGQPGDKYEQEADAVAKQVVQRLHSPVSESPQPEADVQREPEKLQLKPLVQRVHAVGGEAASPEIENGINQAKGGGQPLDAGLQRSMGEAMGADFSSVRVHTDSHADQLNQSIQAKAFTTGQDLFFKQGEYQPGSRGGQELIAHELTHVVQQSNQHSLQKVADIQRNAAEKSIDVNTFRSDMLSAHNDVRNIHGVPNLTLDTSLNNDAQAYAEKLANMGQMKPEVGIDSGENLYSERGFKSAANLGKQAVTTWYKEIGKYDFDRGSSSPFTQHFTQVVWKSSERLGCGLAEKDGTAYVVARYSPPGNYVGTFKKNVLKGDSGSK